MGGGKHVKMIPSIGKTDPITFEPTLVWKTRVILTLIKITTLVITVSEEKIKSGL